MEDCGTTPDLLVWADIPVRDLGRAMAFYAAVLDRQVSREAFGTGAFGLIEHRGGNGACLVLEGGSPGTQGPLLYFSVEGRLQEAVGRALALGGVVVHPVHPIGPHGFRAVIRDSEGNRLALHASSDR